MNSNVVFAVIEAFLLRLEKGMSTQLLDAQIVKAVPRDRNIALFFQKNALSFVEKNILHIAPEWPLFRSLKQSQYVGGDIQKRRNANSIVDIDLYEF
jgi:hypothetical protein